MVRNENAVAMPIVRDEITRGSILEAVIPSTIEEATSTIMATMGARPGLSAPAHLRSNEFALDGDAYVVMSYPVAIVAPLASTSRGGGARHASLSKAEQAVATMFIAGIEARQIAKTRQTSLSTVKNQLRSIYRKLGVQTRLELARAFRR